MGPLGQATNIKDAPETTAKTLALLGHLCITGNCICVSPSHTVWVMELHRILENCIWGSKISVFDMRFLASPMTRPFKFRFNQ